MLQGRPWAAGAICFPLTFLACSGSGPLRPLGGLRRSLKGLVEIQFNDEALGKLQWKDFGNGLSMARLAREGVREMPPWGD